MGHDVTRQEQFLSNRQRYQPISLPQALSDEELAKDWTLSECDRQEVEKYREQYRLSVTIQICAVPLYGRFLNQVHDLSPRIVNYLGQQLDLPPSLTVELPERKATSVEHRQNILRYLGFRRFGETEQQQLEAWLQQKTLLGILPDELFQQAEGYLLDRRILLPGPSVLERLIIHICADAHNHLFESIFQRLPPELRDTIDKLLLVPEGEQRSYFFRLKEYPPAATISAIQSYLDRYQTVAKTGIDEIEIPTLAPGFLGYLFGQAKRYSAADLKRFTNHKRYALMTCFLLETQKILLDHLVTMHDQYLLDIARKCKNTYEQKHRDMRKRQKKAIDTVLDITGTLLDWLEDQPLSKDNLWRTIDEERLRESAGVLRTFKRMEERGYGDLLLARYPSLRKYFAEFIRLPFAAEPGSEALLQAIEIIRKLDSGEIKRLPEDVPTAFVPKELRRALRDESGDVNRNAWETALALVIKDALRSADLYLPQSRHHVSFWNLTLNDSQWGASKDSAYTELEQPCQDEARPVLLRQFRESVSDAEERFGHDEFARIEKGRLLLKRDDRTVIPPEVVGLQKAIDANMPPIRIEKLLMEVNQMTGFSRHFLPVQNHGSRPKNFYRSLMAAIISQATNLGVVSMSASVNGVTVDMLRHVLQHYVREETLKAANAEVVNRHHELPLSAAHGDGSFSSSDAQRFKIQADSLLASYYPRYYGYYEKAIGIYTHVSDQFSVFSTKIISCSPREALYVLDGLLKNNTILKIRAHTTDTMGYTEIIFALCHLLGYSFMPRIRDLKDQQLYRTEKNDDYGVFTPLLNKTADLDIITEQWESMIRVALSLKQRTAPAHVIVQRLMNSSPSDRLSKAFTSLGRIIKTEYILRYLTDPELRRTVQIQLNKGEYRHNLPRRIFFANQGEFTTGDYEEIMNKASCLSLVSNAVLYWNTVKINAIVEGFRKQGETIENETLSHISLLPYNHILAHGTYFNEE
jgi:TnpA family transposase